MVTAWDEGAIVGSALGEAKTAEEAEDNAIARLVKRTLNPLNKETSRKADLKTDNHIDNNKVRKSTKNNEVNSDGMNNNKNQTITHSHNDWSNELNEIEMQLRRLNWNKEDEMKIIKYIFGYDNKNRITDYSQIKVLLSELKSIDKDTTSQEHVDSISKDNLILKSSMLLEILGWSPNKGREYINNQFNVLSRAELNCEQLLSFNNSLKKMVDNLQTST